jgi:hypothetical protein
MASASGYAKTAKGGRDMKRLFDLVAARCADTDGLPHASESELIHGLASTWLTGSWIDEKNC